MSNGINFYCQYQDIPRQFEQSNYSKNNMHEQFIFVEKQDETEQNDGYDDFVAKLERDLYGAPNIMPGITVPKKPLTPYDRFVVERQSQLQKENRDVSQEQLQSILREKWELVNSHKKSQYYNSYEKEMKQYDILKYQYNDLCKKPKKPVTPYYLFFKERLIEIRNEQPSIDMKNATKILSEEWNTLSTENRQKYLLQAAQEKENYDQRLNRFHERMNNVEAIEAYKTNKMIYEDNQQNISEHYQQVFNQEEINIELIRSQQNQKVVALPKKDVDNILGIKTVQGKKFYLIQWNGQTASDASWEEEKNLKEFQDILTLFEETYYTPYLDKQIVHKIQDDDSLSVEIIDEKEAYKKNQSQKAQQKIDQSKSKIKLKQNVQQDTTRRSRTNSKDIIVPFQKTLRTKPLKKEYIDLDQDYSPNKVQKIIRKLNTRQITPAQSVKSIKSVRSLKSMKSMKSVKSIESRLSQISDKSIKSFKNPKLNQKLKKKLDKIQDLFTNLNKDKKQSRQKELSIPQRDDSVRTRNQQKISPQIKIEVLQKMKPKDKIVPQKKQVVDIQVQKKQVILKKVQEPKQIKINKNFPILKQIHDKSANKILKKQVQPIIKQIKKQKVIKQTPTKLPESILQKKPTLKRRITRQTLKK